MEYVVGFDTSNYTTSVAVCTLDGKIVANIKRPLPVGEGACGLRQSDAVFAHVKNLPSACEELRDVVRGARIVGVGVSRSPRQAEGSYMPCFLTGVAAAKSFAAAADAPISFFSHQDGHIRAAVYSCGAEEMLLKSDSFAAFHVSGGTTEILHVVPSSDGFAVTLVGETADLNMGQLIDRTGVMMGLSFPCGRELEQLAAQYEGEIPQIKTCVRDCRCNLSGLQNLAEKLWKESGDAKLVSAYVLRSAAKTLEKMTAQLDAKHGRLPIVYAGGVMSNRYLQSVLSKRKDTYFAEPAFSADNAAGIALLCADQIRRANQN